jgi:phage I-like protein
MRKRKMTKQKLMSKKSKRADSAYVLDLKKKGRALVVSSMVALSAGITGRDASSRTTWIDVGPKGEWAGHADGPFVLDDATFDSIIKHFKKRKSAPQVDYGHGSLFEMDGQPRPAAGYILDLAIENNRLWAKVEFTKRAANYIRAGEYRFCSGVFCWNVTDTESGDSVYAILDSIALTNRPFIDGQNPIMLSHIPSNKRILNTMNKAKLLEALAGLDDETSEEKVMEKLKEMAKKEEEEVKAASDLKAKDEEAKIEEKTEVKVEETKMEEKKDEKKANLVESETALFEAFGMSTDELVALLLEKADEVKALLTADKAEAEVVELTDEATEEELDEELAEATEGDMELPASTMAALSQVRSLSVEVKQLRTQLKKQDGDVLEKEVDALISVGKILPSSKKEYLALAKSAPAQFRALSKQLPVIVPMGKETPAEAKAVELTENADTISETHPTYVKLSNHYNDPKNGWSKLIKGDKKMLDKVVRDHLKRGQQFGV